MIAYTAWDSLQKIAQQFDADLSVKSGTQIALTPHRDRFVKSVPVRRLGDLARRGLALLL